jgi:hypothetical protein
MTDTTEATQTTLEGLVDPKPQQDVAVRQEAPLATQAQPGALLSTILRMASAPQINIDVLRLLMEEQAKAEAKEAQRQFWQAMNAAQTEVQPVARDAENLQTRSFYAKLESVDAVIRPVYAKHGFSLSWTQVAPLVAGNIRIACRCAHGPSGHFETYELEAPADTMGPKGSPTKTALHGLGSTDTYLRRYITCGIFNVVLKDRDLDGNSQRRAVSDEQRDQLLELLDQLGDDGNIPLFCRTFEVEAVADLDAANFAPAMNLLNMRLQAKRRKEKEGAAS